ncbi:serine hydrolase domain-containing protein [Nocardioides stalactiti]|uniref:serine hydrolase domain-containing protein n=1 Tax=Nocardioides stalactiti TaxID=2755356 RepID=UPI00160118BF|nr:serine hydrolase domain-containing protein [Nocardioides stalactiti]
MHPVAGVLDSFVQAGEPGAAVCVVRDGEIEVEHHVGTRDGTVPWDADTLVMTYSVAKPFAALTVLSAVADGALALDQRVADLWPEYGAHGKGSTTVRHVLSHAAGLPCFPAAAADVPYDDEAVLVGLLADAAPDHEPGSAVAEHALTYGHLCAEVLRRATGEDLADRFAGIAAGHGWDLHLRVAPADRGRVADVVAHDEAWPSSYLSDPRWGPALGRPTGLLDPAVLNSERFRTTSFPAIALHASARGLARFYAGLLAADGPVRDLLGPDLHAAYIGPAATGRDRVLDRDVTWTLGFQVDAEDIGMGGAGGSSAWWSFAGDYAAAFVTRGLGTHDRSGAVWDALEPR